MAIVPPRLREVVETAEFRQELSKIEKTAKRADEYIDGMIWVLARDPSSGVLVNTSGNVWMISTNPSLPVQMVVYYTFDLTKVYLLWIEITP